MNNRNNKCCCKTISNRVCKNKIYICNNDYKYCYIHANIYLIKHVNKIKNAWFIYKQNKKFQLYKTLPEDIKYYLKYKLHENYYLEKSIYKILFKKINYLKNIYIHNNHETTDNLINNVYEVNNVIKLILSYLFILNKNDLEYMMNISNRLNKYFLGILISTPNEENNFPENILENNLTNEDNLIIQYNIESIKKNYKIFENISKNLLEINCLSSKYLFDLNYF